MTISDSLGQTLTGASAASVVHYETAIRQLQCYIGDPVASVDQALQASPDFVMAHLLKGYLHLLGTEPEALPVARECYSAARRLPVDDRERGHLRAVGQLVEGRWREAGRTLEDVSIEYPRDALALQAGHQIDFFTGNSACCATVLPGPCRRGVRTCPDTTLFLACMRSDWRKPGTIGAPKRRGAEASNWNRATAGPSTPWRM